MSDHFDPIERWLGTDVELMPPPPGAFERIHHRARRRKTIVAMSAAAGAAVVIAAAAALPQLASSLFPGHGGPSRFRPPAASSSHTPKRNHPPASPKPHSNPARPESSTPPAGSNLTISGSSVPATPGIAPSSVTFVSASVGAVIGVTTSSCPGGCVAVAATPDYGQTWRQVSPPPAGPPNGDSGVSQIRFLQSTDGWAFGPELYATHDGGANWAKISLPGRVIDLATVGGSAFAVVARCEGLGAGYASGCSSFSLYWTPYNADSWQPVTGAAGKYPVVPGGLQLTSQNGYLLAGSALFTGSPGGGPWHKVTISSGTVPSCLAGRGHSAASGEPGVLAPGPSGDLFLICQPPGGQRGILYTSTDSGSTWQSAGHVRVTGAVTSLAVAPGSGTIVLGTTEAIYYSADARHWQPATLASRAPAGGFGFVGMTTQLEGVAVAPSGKSKLIYITADGGQSWHAGRI
jgi:photosystem II stability/assembly factor-like uncharacterized protein